MRPKVRSPVLVFNPPKNSTYVTYISSNFADLRWYVSEIKVLNMKKDNAKT